MKSNYLRTAVLLSFLIITFPSPHVILPNAIILLVSTSQYNLNSYNCTDFGMNVTNASGLSLPSAYGTWGMIGIGSGAGDNPGQLGQNIRNMPTPTGAVKTTTTGNAQINAGGC